MNNDYRIALIEDGAHVGTWQSSRLPSALVMAVQLAGDYWMIPERDIEIRSSGTGRWEIGSGGDNRIVVTQV